MGKKVFLTQTVGVERERDGTQIRYYGEVPDDPQSLRELAVRIEQDLQPGQREDLDAKLKSTTVGRIAELFEVLGVSRDLEEARITAIKDHLARS